MPDANILNEAIAVVMDENVKRARTVVPGKVSLVTRQLLGEVDVNFDAGIGKRSGGQASADGTAPMVPVLYPGGGGYSMRWPMHVDDECVALVSDRPTGLWRTTKLVGQAPAFAERHHNLSDALVLPVRITPPTPTAPATVTNEVTDWILAGPLGDAIRVGPTGAVTISKAGAPAVLATISMDAAGKVTITPAAGQTVEVGGVLPLALYDPLITAIDSMLAALVAAGAGNAFLGAATAQTAWNSAKAAIASAITKGA